VFQIRNSCQNTNYQPTHIVLRNYCTAFSTCYAADYCGWLSVCCFTINCTAQGNETAVKKL